MAAKNATGVVATMMASLANPSSDSHIGEISFTATHAVATSVVGKNTVRSLN
ncbi:MAG TPA: hypothetical protein VNH11_06760 [Pirellulales bacterium]|nr:hypothetical protein [Pirellulales bacterium]